MQETGLRHRCEKMSRQNPPCITCDESGLTGPQWLLVVAAVAGLIALATVVAGNVVSGTSGAGVGGSTRASAAKAAAAAVVEEAKYPGALDDPRWDTWNDWERHFTAECDTIRLVFSDVVVRVISNFEAPPITVGAHPQAAELRKATTGSAVANAPQAQCEVML